MVKACVENGAHHIDISGEPQVCTTDIKNTQQVTVAQSQ